MGIISYFQSRSSCDSNCSHVTFTASLFTHSSFLGEPSLHPLVVERTFSIWIFLHLGFNKGPLSVPQSKRTICILTVVVQSGKFSELSCPRIILRYCLLLYCTYNTVVSNMRLTSTVNSSHASELVCVRSLASCHGFQSVLIGGRQTDR